MVFLKEVADARFFHKTFVRKTEEFNSFKGLSLWDNLILFFVKRISAENSAGVLLKPKAAPGECMHANVIERVLSKQKLSRFIPDKFCGKILKILSNKIQNKSLS